MQYQEDTDLFKTTEAGLVTLVLRTKGARARNAKKNVAGENAPPVHTHAFVERREPVNRPAMMLESSPFFPAS